MKVKGDEEMLKCYKNVYDKLSQRGIDQMYHVMDNESSTTILQWIKKQHVMAQKFASHNHRANKIAMPARSLATSKLQTEVHLL